MTYYQILDIPEKATTGEVKSAFRTLAHHYHPDKNQNSPKSNLEFQRIHNAYTVLSNREKRWIYDEYLKNSTVIKKSTQATALGSKHQGDTTIKQVFQIKTELNYILWEIEDIIRLTRQRNSNAYMQKEQIEEYLYKILIFFDRRVLEEAGFGDYFFEARKLGVLRPSAIVNTIKNRIQHSPYTSFDNYFYEIRKRMDKFLNRLNVKLLTKTIPNTELVLNDALFEGAMLSYHYLGSLQKIINSGKENVTAYEFINKDFDDSKKELIQND